LWCTLNFNLGKTYLLLKTDMFFNKLIYSKKDLDKLKKWYDMKNYITFLNEND